MSIKEYVSKEVLEARVKEQNLIHELVVINQLLVEAADRLQNEANKIPQLHNQIDQLQAELRKALQGSPNKSTPLITKLEENRIERSRLEASQIQYKDNNFCFQQKANKALKPSTLDNEAEAIINLAEHKLRL